MGTFTVVRYEWLHEKMYLWTCGLSKDSDQSVHPCNVISLQCSPEVTLNPNSNCPKSAQERMVRPLKCRLVVVITKTCLFKYREN